MQRRVTVTTPVGDQSHIIIDKAVMLGNGQYGRVYIGSVLATQEQLAVKLIELKDDRDRVCVNYEIEIMKHLTHSESKNLVQLHGYSGESDKAAIAMTYASNGALNHWLTGIAHPHLTSLQQTKIMRGIACGLSYMHQLNVVHCDVKPANILLDCNMEPMLCDFGLSLRDGDRHDSGVGGSPMFFPPELLLAIARRGDTCQTKAGDLYAFALVCWCIVAKSEFPYNHIDIFPELFQWVVSKNLREPIPPEPQCPKTIARLIESEWNADPAQRPSASAAMIILDEELERLSNVVDKKISPAISSQPQTVNCFARLFSASHSSALKMNHHDKHVGSQLSMTM